jgi:hypothetical protein
MTMTKQEEIEILKATAKKLGPDSYVGPWLAEQLPAMIGSIMDDLSPDACGVMTIADARRKASEIIHEAHDKRRKIEAESEAKEKQAMERVDFLHRRIRNMERAIQDCKQIMVAI